MSKTINITTTKDLRDKLQIFILALYGGGLISDDTEDTIRLDYLKGGLISDEELENIFGDEK